MEGYTNEIIEYRYRLIGEAVGEFEDNEAGFRSRLSAVGATFQISDSGLTHRQVMVHIQVGRHAIEQLRRHLEQMNFPTPHEAAVVSVSSLSQAVAASQWAEQPVAKITRRRSSSAIAALKDS